MTKHTLPIPISNARTVDVPCDLPESFDFQVFLPSRGIRTFTAWLTSKGPKEAEVKDVQLSNREGDPRAGLSYEVDEDEQRRADEAAGDVLVSTLTLLGLAASCERVPLPISSGSDVRRAIGLAWDAEELAVERQTQLCAALDRAKLSDASRDAYKLVPDLTSERGKHHSAACEAMRGYVEHVVEQAVLAQSANAERQLADYPRARSGDEDAPGSERIHAPRSLDTATLKCLDLDY